MNSSSHAARFDLKRLFLLGKIASIDDWKPYLLTGVVIGTLVFFGELFVRPFSGDFLLNLMLFAGIVHVAKVFYDFHEQEKGIYFFTLPASVKEKYLVRLLATALGYFVFSVFVCFVGSILGSAVHSMTSNSAEFYLHNPFNVELVDKFGTYIFFHAIFFCGSLYFKKNSFLKTLLTVIGVVVLLMIGAASLLDLTDFNLPKLLSWLGHIRDVDGTIQVSFPDGLSRFRMATGLVLPAALYILSYFKFKKIEIKG
ncbi:MAG: hypothetical protein GY866_27295 [Proteobacteria bacterium]|nr:hypothetical protein [Pseudomonadota bacterium]